MGRRVGILGGSFDPIHYGHLRLAEEAREAWPLDELLFAPAGVSPFKVGVTSTAAEDRLAMLRLALEDRTDVAVEMFELERKGPSFTVDTLEYLRGRRPGDEFVLILGHDAWVGFPKWKRWRDIARTAHLFVGRRQGGQVSDLPAVFGIDAPEPICYDRSGERFRFPSGREVFLASTPVLDISSTILRERAAAGRSLRYLMPPSVAEYIHARGLYRNPPPEQE